MTLFRSLKHRRFALLWTGQTISRVGDGLYRVALSWWVLEKTGSAAEMGTVLIAGSVPLLLFLLLGGAAVDRFSRSRVMLLSDLARGCLVAAISFLAFSNLLVIWHLYLFSVAFGFVEAFFQPAYVALVPEITPSAGLTSANSLTTLSAEMAGIVGPAIGAALVALGGTPFAFGLNSLSFFISAAFLAPLFGLAAPKRVEMARPSFLEDLREGFKAVFSSAWLWGTIAIAGFANLTVVGPIGVALPFLVKTNLSSSVGGHGLLLTAFSAGSVLGAVWLGRVRQIRRRGLVAYGAWILGGLMLMTFGLPLVPGIAPEYALILIALTSVIMGASISTLNLIWANTLQELVPGHLLGRVSSIDQLGSFALVPVGLGAAGWATDLIGAPLVFLIGGAATAAMGAIGLAIPEIRNLD